MTETITYEGEDYDSVIVTRRIDESERLMAGHDYEGASGTLRVHVLRPYDKRLEASCKSKVYLLLGLCQHHLGNLAGAIEYYEEAHRLNPDDESISLNLEETRKLQAARASAP